MLYACVCVGSWALSLLGSTRGQMSGWRKEASGAQERVRQEPEGWGETATKISPTEDIKEQTHPGGRRSCFFHTCVSDCKSDNMFMVESQQIELEGREWVWGPAQPREPQEVGGLGGCALTLAGAAHLPGTDSSGYPQPSACAMGWQMVGLRWDSATSLVPLAPRGG